MNRFGKIVKGIGGFYYVKTDSDIIECRARGKFRKDSQMPYVGDNVEISVEGNNGYVLNIMERKNVFLRPPISNVDKLILVSATDNPKPDLLYIDKMLVTAASNNTEIALCFNKSDLDKGIAQYYKDLYTQAGYRAFVTSTTEASGIEELKEFMKGSVTALCGFSGVGKSSLINLLMQKNVFEVGEISSKLNRGKHTTRHVELIEYDENSYFADTPGFSMLNLSEQMNCDELISFFPDLKKYSYDCKFSDCSHTSNKFCSVYDALNDDKILKSRYDNYVTLYNILKENKEWKK